MIGGMATSRILMGVLGRPHGVRGLLRVVSYAADAADLTAYGPLTDEAGRRFVLRWQGPGVVAVDEMVGARRVPVADRDAAARLTNTRLFIDRAELPPPEPEEFYYTDLIGLAAVDAAGHSVGQVAVVHDYGAGVSLEIDREQRAPVLLPFTRACVPDIDIARGRVTVCLPDEIIAAGAAA
jgi:16S rRNA processing protein RimM